MENIWIIIPIFTVLIITFIYSLRHLKGNYTIKTSEIINEGKVTSNGIQIGQYFIIKTIYKNGRIKIKKTEHI